MIPDCTENRSFSIYLLQNVGLSCLATAGIGVATHFVHLIAFTRRGSYTTISGVDKEGRETIDVPNVITHYKDINHFPFLCIYEYTKRKQINIKRYKIGIQMTYKVKNKSAWLLLFILATAMIIINYILDESIDFAEKYKSNFTVSTGTTISKPNNEPLPIRKTIVNAEKNKSNFTLTRNYSIGTSTISKPNNEPLPIRKSIDFAEKYKSNFTVSRSYFTGTTTISKPNNEPLPIRKRKVIAENNESNFTVARNYSLVTTTVSKQNIEPLPIRKEYCPNSKWFLSTQPENEITVVTAYFNIGSFIKGSAIKFTPDRYLKWMTSFRYLNNPLVVYVDEQKTADIFKNLRKHLMNITKIVVLDRKYMWSFGLKNRIEQIYSPESYPKFHPNTVVPEYSCAQHAKYECLHNAISKDYFSTPYFSWLDIGYFRDIVGCKKDFKLVLPDNFNKTKISYTQVREFNQNITLSSIFLKNSLWVGGGMTLASKEVTKKFIRIFKNSVEILLEQSLMNTDQQVIYAIYSKVGRALFKPTVEIQLHRSGDWFYLGFLCHRSYNKSVILSKSSAIPTYTTSTFKPS
ncbi:uncharacterized protein LOC126821568 isoform X2 [Patella vulgata]|uniref:uncharacterized protein LOC126821568 isoform X2 n=1 Tax=Patella vulgata TaxID=6465 RepID=UPI0024A8CA2B|nr:uncharacterized protein LOC126821568 isoform X2 [Patella vulgata]